MDSALLSQALSAGTSLLGSGLAKGSAAGMGSGIGASAGSLLGSAFLGPLGGQIGGAAGNLLGGGLEQLMNSGKKRPKRKAAVKKRLVAAAAPGAVRRSVQQVATQSGVPVSMVAGKTAQAAQAIQQAKAARHAASSVLARAFAQAPGGLPALAQAAGLPATLVGKVDPGLLVRRAGLGRLARLAGFSNVDEFATANGVNPKLIRLLGLHLSAPQAMRRRALVGRAVRTVVDRAPGVEVELSGLSDAPIPVPPSGEGPPLNKAEGKIPRTPGAVPVRPENWKLDTSTYVLSWGDTLTGLAVTYLGNGGRWREIWDAQPGSFRESNKPDKLGVGQALLMPAEAVANARVLVANPGSRVQPNGEVIDPHGVVVSALPPWVKTAAAAAGLAALLGVAYMVSR